MFNWLHISDLHMEDGRRTNFQKELFNYLQTNKDMVQNLDAIFITGDFCEANMDMQPENERHKSEKQLWYKQFIHDLKDMIYKDVPIYLAPGNHDVLGRTERRELIQNARNKYDWVNISEGRFDREILENMLPSFDNYYYYVDHKVNNITLELFETNQVKRKKALIDNPHYLHTIEGKVNILILNTVLLYSDVVDVGRLLVGVGHIDDLLRKVKDKSLPTIVIAHNHLNDIAKDERDILYRKFKEHNVLLYLCGHYHNFEAESIRKIGHNLYINSCGNLKKEFGSKAGFILGHLDDFNLGQAQAFVMEENRGRIDIKPYENFYTNEYEDSSESILKIYPSIIGENSEKHFLNAYLLGDPIIKNSLQFNYDFSERFSLPLTYRIQDSSDEGKDTFIDFITLLSYCQETFNDNNFWNLYIYGEGGTGKTTAFIKLWEQYAQHKFAVPVVYIPLFRCRGGIRNFLVENGYGDSDFIINHTPIDKPLRIYIFDGYNEIAKETRVDLKIEMDKLMQNRNLQCIVSGRKDNDWDGDAKLVKTSIELNKKDIEKFLSDYSIKNPQRFGDSRRIDQAMEKILNTPLMIKLFTQSLTGLKHEEMFKLKGFDFSTKQEAIYISSGEVLWNYFCVECDKMLDLSKFSSAQIKFYLFYILPLIGNVMETREELEIAFDSTLRNKINHLLDTMHEYHFNPVGVDLVDFKYDTLLRQKDYLLDITMEVSNTLHIINYLPNNKISFAHQIIRDFGSALYHYNNRQMELKYPEMEYNNITRNLPDYVREYCNSLTDVTFLHEYYIDTIENINSVLFGRACCEIADVYYYKYDPRNMNSRFTYNISKDEAFKLAIEYFVLSANHDNAYACWSLSFIFRTEVENYRNSFNEAKKRNDTASLEYLNSSEKKKQLEEYSLKAYAYCQTAFDLGYPLAYNMMGRLYEYGIGVNRNISEALNYYHEAIVKHNIPDSYNAIARIFENQNDYFSAFMYFYECAEIKSVAREYAWNRLGWYIIEGKVNDNDFKIENLKKYVYKNSIESEINDATNQLIKLSTYSNRLRFANKYLEKAERAGNAYAKSNLEKGKALLGKVIS